MGQTRLSASSLNNIPQGGDKCAIVIEMSPLIRSKCTDTKDINSFSDLAVLLCYEVLRLGSDFERIDIVFDRYFENSLKEDTRKGQG